MKRTRLNRVSKKNSHKKQNLGLRRQYMNENPDCEFGKNFSRFPFCDSCDPHHIFGGTSGRDDLLSNLIALSREAHDWCHAHPHGGRVLAIWIKHIKREFSESEFRQASGSRIQGWLARVSVADWIEPYRRKLIEAYP